MGSITEVSWENDKERWEKKRGSKIWRQPSTTQQNLGQTTWEIQVILDDHGSKGQKTKDAQDHQARNDSFR